MPIISDLGSIGNLFINLMKLIIQNPLYAVIFLIMILFLPLNLLDLILFVFINFFIALFNLIIWIIIIPINLLIWFLDFVKNLIITLIYLPINLIIGILGGTAVTPPGTTLPTIPYISLSYINIDFFGDQDTIIGKLIDSLGWSFPLWKMGYHTKNNKSNNIRY